jgi:hypothetical protein
MREAGEAAVVLALLAVQVAQEVVGQVVLKPLRELPLLLTRAGAVVAVVEAQMALQAVQAL